MAQQQQQPQLQQPYHPQQPPSFSSQQQTFSPQQQQPYSPQQQPYQPQPYQSPPPPQPPTYQPPPQQLQSPPQTQQYQPPPPAQQYQPRPPTQQFQPPPPNQSYQPPTIAQQYQQSPPPPQQYKPPPLTQQHQLPPHQQQQQPYYGQQQQPYHPQHYLPSPPVREPKLDPHAMPSVAHLISSELNEFKDKKDLIFQAPAKLPPLVTTLEGLSSQGVNLQDAGCARPCHMRSTIYAIPVNKDLLESSNLEFSVVVKPFDDGEVMKNFLVPLSPHQIVRCNRCKAYANPFSAAAKRCAICGINNDSMPQMDELRPELHYGSYEFRVGPEYYRNQIAETRRPHIIFAIEMTASSKHLVHFLSKHLADVIKDHFPTDFLYAQSLSPLVGFATYNSKITLYDVVNGSHAYVISDMTSVIDCASTSKFLVDPKEHFDKIEKFLASLVDISNEQADQEQQTVLGPVIEATLKTCLYDTSNNFQADPKKSPNPKVTPTGKIYLLHASLPTSGDDTTPGRLGMKRNIDEMKRQLGTENESKVLASEGKYYTQLAEKCMTDYASGVELFLFPPHPRAYLNVSTLGDLARLTGTGVINKYHITSLNNFIEDLKFSLKSTAGFDASMRVRTSTGISADSYIGNFKRVDSNLEMAAVNTTSNFVVQMKYDDKLPENELVVVQFAMIYTSLCGERRVRVHNLALSTCQILADVYKSACCDTLVNVLVRDALEKMRAGTLSPRAAKEKLTTRVINILAAYRKNCTEISERSTTQLILPEGLKLLPVYLCGLLKCDAIDGGMEMFPDDKVLAQFNLLGALPSQSQVTIYPRMYSIEPGTEDGDDSLKAVLERCYNIALEEARGHCYVLENGQYLFVYFPSNKEGQSFLSDVFGPAKDEQDINWDHRQKDSTGSRFIDDLISRISLERRRALRVVIVRQGRDKLEPVFKTFLYEDKKRPDGGSEFRFENPSYVDTLCYLHNQIRAKLSQ